MKKKNKKFQSLKSILWLLQKVQMNEFGKRTFMIDTYHHIGSESITVSPTTRTKEGIFEENFYFNTFKTAEENEAEYNALLKYIKDN